MVRRRLEGAALIVALTAALIAPTGASAQPEADKGNVYDHAAALILQVMPADDLDWTLSWTAVGLRTDPGLVHWHLGEVAVSEDRAPALWRVAEPDAPALENAAPFYRRGGWLGARGAQIGVAACGTDTTVEALAFRWSGEEQAELEAALERAGATLEPSELDGGARISVAGREASALSSTVSCNSPESRAGRSCWTNARVVLRPDNADTRPTADACVLPGRY